MRSHSILAGATLLAVSIPPAAQTTAPATTLARQLAEGGNAPAGFDMAPETRLEIVQAAVDAIPAKIPAGRFRPTWESLEQHYTVPDWFYDAKFGNIPSLAAGADVQGTIAGVSMLGNPGRLEFARDAAGLKVTFPTPSVPPRYAYVLKIVGLRMNPSTRTASGNPLPGR
jgi:hypothetical protein